MITVNKKFLKELSSLSPQQKLLIAESLIEELEAPIPDFEREWIEESQRRLKEMKSGKVKTLSFKEVFGKYAR